MTDEELLEDVNTATGQAYGRGVSAEEIVDTLEAARARWEKHPEVRG